MITFQADGSAGSGSTSISCGYPASIAAGDTLLLFIASKHPSNGPVTPTGWTLVNQTSGGAGSPGADDGPALCSVYLRTCDGTETGSVVISIPSGNSAIGRISRYKSYGPVTATAVGVANNTASAAWSVTFGSDPGIIGGDYCVVCSAVNTDGPAITTGALTVPGVGFATQGGNFSFATPDGDDVRIRTSHHNNTTGGSSGAATYVMTADSGTPSGASVLVVLREAAIQYGSRGATGASSGATLSLPFPSNIAVGDALACLVVNKYPTNGPTTPSGWTLAAQVSGGVGSAGSDTGTVYSTVFTRIADGSETGSLVISIPSNNIALGTISRYFRTGTVLAFAASGGPSNTPGTAWSATCAANPGIAAGTFIVALSAQNTDARSFSAEAISATGATFEPGLEIVDGGSALGDDLRITLSHHFCMTGAASAAPVYTMTASGSDGITEPAGATVLLALNAGIGTLSKPLAAVTLAAAGTSRVSGTLAKTLAGASSVIAGTSPIAGALAVTLAGATAGIAGASTVAGTLAVTLAAATVAAAGTSTVTGALAVTLASATAGVAGTSTVTGTLAVTLAGASAAATGTSTVTGTLPTVLAAVTLAAAGTSHVSGTLAKTLGDVTAAGTSVAPVVAAVLQTLDAASLSASGAVRVTGSCIQTLEAATVADTATAPIAAALARTLEAATCASAATAPVAATVAQTLGNVVPPPSAIGCLELIAPACASWSSSVRCSEAFVSYAAPSSGVDESIDASASFVATVVSSS